MDYNLLHWDVNNIKEANNLLLSLIDTTSYVVIVTSVQKDQIKATIILLVCKRLALITK